LYISAWPESRQVFELLEAAGVDFRAIASRRRVPVATFGRLRFRGLAEARRLADLLHELEAAWLAEARVAMPRLIDSPEPPRMAAMEAMRARWRKQARGVLARVQAERGFETACSPGTPSPAVISQE
jgi:hypothetical protein